jgi:hypothetical protein
MRIAAPEIKPCSVRVLKQMSEMVDVGLKDY